jgi:excisionase family DNA binding protein
MTEWQEIEKRITENVVEALSKRPLQRRVLSVREAAEYLGCDESTVRNFHAAGNLPAVRATTRLQFDLVDLDAFIERNKKR